MFGHLNFIHEIPLLEVCRCSLCHSLGKGFGPLARWFTNYDLAMTMVFALGENGESPSITKRLCPIVTRKGQIVGHGPLKEFLAAVTVILIFEKVRDDEHDEGASAGRWARRWLERNRRKAEAILSGCGFDAHSIEVAFARQRELEGRPNLPLEDAARSTSEIMATIYAHAGILACRWDDIEHLAEIGSATGEIIYALDSIVDYGDDVRLGRFNPLRGCASGLTVSGTIQDNAMAEAQRFLYSAFGRVSSAIEKIALAQDIRDLFTSSLRRRIDEVLSTNSETDDPFCGSFMDRIGDLSPISLFFFPRQALAAGGQASSGCPLESLIPFAIMLFILNAVLKKCVGRGLCGSSRPDRITVDDGCAGTKTYKRDPCSGKYRRDGC